MTDLALGMLLPYGEGLITSGSFVRDFAMTAEAAGVESLWSVEHVVVADDYEPNYPYSASGRMPSGGGVMPMPDPLELLAFIAGVTDRIVLGTSVVVAPLHSPVVLAKRAATIDRLSGGRLQLGLGIGWQREEYAAVGAPFSGRGKRLDECIGAMRALWRDEPATFLGKTVSFEKMHSLPRPGAGAIPIILGGNSEPAIDRVARVGDGWFPYTVGPDELAAGAAQVAKIAEASGRDPSDITITVWPGSADHARDFDIEWLRSFVAAGARRLVVRPPIAKADDLAALPEWVERYQSDVLSRL